MSDASSNGARLRQAVKADYLAALGMAAWSFASCEWQVCWCCEKIKPGSLRKIVGDELTAGKIAAHFKNLTRNMPKSAEREQLKDLAEEFATLVERRNSIIHGKPCTGPNGESRLSSAGVIEIPDLEDAADAFAECCSKLNRIFHSFLKTYVPPHVQRAANISLQLTIDARGRPRQLPLSSDVRP